MLDDAYAERHMAKRKISSPASLVQSPSPTSDSRDLPDEDFATLLRSMMRSKGLTAADLSRAIQKEIPAFSPGNISHYLAGRSMPRSQVLNVLSGVLGIDLQVYNFAHRRLNESPTVSAPTEEARTERAALPAMSVSDAGDGKAFIQINQVVDWAIALHILQIFQDKDRR